MALPWSAFTGRGRKMDSSLGKHTRKVYRKDGAMSKYEFRGNRGGAALGM